MTSRLLFLLVLGLAGRRHSFVAATTTDEEHLRTALQRRVPLGRFRPSADDLAQPDERDLVATERDLLTLQETCTIILDSYLGKTGVERLACQNCRVNPADRNEYILSCDFTDICSFCSPEDDVCYTLTHEYIVRPWRGDIRQNEDIAYSACGTYHFGGREKVCLDETYTNWGYLDTQCVSVDGVSCGICQINPECGAYRYRCGNIEPNFMMDSCDYEFNDTIPKTSVFVGFNYGMYAEDTSTCFDGNGTGNIPATPPPPPPAPPATMQPTPPPTTAAPIDAPTAGPTESPINGPTQTPIATPTVSPTEAPTAPPTAGPSTLTPTEVPTGSTIVQTGTPTKAPTALPTQGPRAAPTAGPTTALQTASPVRSVVFTSPKSPSPTSPPTKSPTNTPATAGPTSTPLTLEPASVPTSQIIAESSVPVSGDGDEARTSVPTEIPTASTIDQTDTPTCGSTHLPATESPVRSVIFKNPSTEAPTSVPVSTTSEPTAVPTSSTVVQSSLSPISTTEAPTNFGELTPPTAVPVSGDGDETVAPPTAVPLSGDGDETVTAPTAVPFSGDGDEANPSPTTVPFSGDGDENSPSTTFSPTLVPTSNVIPEEDSNSTAMNVTSVAPSFAPSLNMTEAPSLNMTEAPSLNMTEAPSLNMTEAPSLNMTEAPSLNMTEAPSLNMTEAPTQAPSLNMTEVPSFNLTEAPTQAPSLAPTANATIAPSGNHTSGPTGSPTSQPSDTPTGKPSSAPTLSMVPSAAPTQQTVIPLDDFSMTLSFPDNATLDIAQMTTVMEGYLHTAFLADYENLKSIDLKTSSRRRLTQSATIAFSGEASFFGEAPLPSSVQARQAATLDDTESVQAALEPYDVVLESVALDDSSGASLTGVATGLFLVSSCVMGLFLW